MSERVGNRRSRVRLYILLNLDRLLFTALLALGLFIVVLGFEVFTIPSFRTYMIQYDPTRYVFQAFITALITGVTLVVTITQLVLSQELGPLGEQRDRMSGSVAFRGDVEDIFGATSPADPSGFLRALVENSSNRAESLRENVTGHSNDEIENEIDQLVDSIVDNANVVSDELEDRTFGEYTVVKAALDYNYSLKLHQARRIRNEYGDDLGDDTLQKLVHLIDILSFFGPAREHIKTLYFQWELVDLSRGMLYMSVPALAVAVAFAMYLAPSSFQGATFGISNLVWATSIGATVGCLPFLFLSTYILRLATIAKRTLAVGPFILRESDRSSDIEWE